jgi:predicted ATP-dependent serine protease
MAKQYALEHEGKVIKVGFTSAEMRDSEWAKELAALPMLKNLEVTYMLDYAGHPDYERIFYESIADVDIAVVDSFPATITHIRMNPLEKRSEKVIINDIIAGINKSVKANNNNVQLINQATKDGNYKGGTDLPHMMTSLAFVKIEGEQRHWTFVKNRNNGNVNRQLFFGRDENNCIEFDEVAYDLTYAPRKDREDEIYDVLGLTKDFDTAEKLDFSKPTDEENAEIMENCPSKNDDLY